MEYVTSTSALRSIKCILSCRCRNSFHESVKQIGSVQHQGSAGSLGTYETVQHFNEIKEHLHMVKREVEHLVQRSAQVRVTACSLTDNS